MSDEHRPVISLAEIAPLLQGPLIWCAWAWNRSSGRDKSPSGRNLNTPPSCQPSYLFSASQRSCLYHYVPYIFSSEDAEAHWCVCLNNYKLNVPCHFADIHGPKRMNTTAWVWPLLIATLLCEISKHQPTLAQTLLQIFNVACQCVHWFFCWVTHAFANATSRLKIFGFEWNITSTHNHIPHLLNLEKLWCLASSSSVNTPANKRHSTSLGCTLHSVPQWSSVNVSMLTHRTKMRWGQVSLKPYLQRYTCFTLA